jgi:hypothetical protein
MTVNRQVLVKELPTGDLTEDNFEMFDGPMPELGAGEVLCRTILVSIDPVIRTWMSTSPLFRPEHPGLAAYGEAADDPGGDGDLGLEFTRGAQPFRDIRKVLEPGDVCEAFTLCEVVDSNGTDLPEGTIVVCVAGMQEYAAVPAAWARPIEVRTALSHHFGVLGITGLTAWFGLLGTAPPLPGDTVVISSAAGGVGHVAAQLANIAGGRVVGISSSDEKNAYLVDELGLAAAVNYRDPDFAAALAAACPHGADVFLDLVGGPVLETVLGVMNDHGRVSGSGFVAHYGNESLGGPANMPAAYVVKRLTIRGFTVTDAIREWPEAERRLAGFIADGRLRVVEELIDGLDAAPAAVVRQMDGGNVGKWTVRVAPDPA